MLEDPKVREEAEKIRKQHKKLNEQWEKEIQAKAKRIACLLGAARILLKTIETDEDNIPSPDEIYDISVFLATSTHPNPLNQPVSIPRKPMSHLTIEGEQIKMCSTKAEKKRIIEDQLRYLSETIDFRRTHVDEVTLENFEQFEYEDYTKEIPSKDDYIRCINIIRRLSEEIS